MSARYYVKILNITIAITIVVLSSCYSGNGKQWAKTLRTTGADSTNAHSKQQTGDQQAHTLTMLFVGDLMQHDSQINAARNSDGSYDYSDCFRYIKHEIESADIAVGNLELTFGGRPYKGYPMFSAPDEFLRSLQEAGFDILLTSNNHCVDRGMKGLERTIAMLDSANMQHLGTYRNADERKKNYPYMLTAKGFRIAMLNYTYGTNGLPVPTPYIVNLTDTSQILRDIADAQQKQPNAIIAFMHWGDEYKLLPNNKQHKMADWLINHGVTHIIGGHPHVIQPIELRTGANGEQHLIAWSLGNFISGMSAPNTYGGMMLKLTLEKAYDKVRTKASYSMAWVSRPSKSEKKQYRIYPTNIDTAILNNKEKAILNAFQVPTNRLLTKYNRGI